MTTIYVIFHEDMIYTNRFTTDYYRIRPIMMELCEIHQNKLETWYYRRIEEEVEFTADMGDMMCWEHSSRAPTEEDNRIPLLK